MRTPHGVNGAATGANGEGAASAATGDDDIAHAEPMAFATAVIHGGQRVCPVTGAVFPPLYTSSTFAQQSPGVHQGFEYSRSHNPTRFAFERCYAALEGTGLSEANDTTCGAFAFASGLAAGACCLELLDAGATVVCMDDVYGGTHRLLNRVRARSAGLKIVKADLSDQSEAEAAILGGGVAMVWLETPTNPTLKLADIAAVAALARAAGALLVVDNTFATPALTRPLQLGADIVLSSTTKYVAGHSDSVGGALATRHAELAGRLRFLQNAIGAVMSPWDAYLTLRGAKTLAVRMQRHCANAATLAARLEAAAAAGGPVARVAYPGLASHPQHALAARQMRLPGPARRAASTAAAGDTGDTPARAPGFGGMISLTLAGGLPEARAFLGALELFALAESLGGVESLAEHPAIMTHGSVPPAERAALGIGDGFVRLSVGIEDVEDLWADLERALAAAAAAAAGGGGKGATA
ncbi:MAG: cystathionine beta-lyase [Monoraphidium minutum]|nr:MAG: cystathionine beta-lyase [Monoraphidium minutum]